MSQRAKSQLEIARNDRKPFHIMMTTLTDEILVAYSQCPRKAYLLMYSEERGQLHDYQKILEQNRLANRSKHLGVLMQNKSTVYPFSTEKLKEGCEPLVEARLTADGLQADCDFLTSVDKQTYEPTIFIGSHKINDTDRLRLMFIGHVLAKVQGNPPTTGHIIAMDGKQSKVRLRQNGKALTSLLDPLQEWATSASPAEPPVILNKHCALCQFRIQCQAKAVEEDNLSRLAGVSARVLRKYERKGIFTVKQLSYLFKPRKRKKRSKNPPLAIHNIELQALAIRTGRIYLQELPTLAHQENELFLDIESVPDQDLYYLIGLLVRQGETCTYHSFWANKANDEETIWQGFRALVNQYPSALIFHYGSYESRTIAKLAKRYKTDGESLNKRMINVHKHIYGKVYFPVCSNRLKDVAGFVGATWTHPDASGLQSIVWRYKWDKTHEDCYRGMLLTYNEEDCRALESLVDELSKIQRSAVTLPEVDFADRFKQRTTEASEKVSSQFKEILKSAYFGYDKKKIQFRQDEIQETKQDKTEIRKLAAKRFVEKLFDIRRRDRMVVQVAREKVCPECGYESLTPTPVISRRFIVDLVLAENGIQKTVTEYNGGQAFCSKCKKSYAPAEIRRYRNQMYGHGLKRIVT